MALRQLSKAVSHWIASTGGGDDGGVACGGGGSLFWHTLAYVQAVQRAQDEEGGVRRCPVRKVAADSAEPGVLSRARLLTRTRKRIASGP